MKQQQQQQQWILSRRSEGRTGVVERLDSVQVLVDFVLDSLQPGAGHAGVYQGLGRLLRGHLVSELNKLNTDGKITHKRDSRTSNGATVNKGNENNMY